MQTAQNGRIFTEQLNIRLRPSDKEALETRAVELRKSAGEMSREVLLRSLQVSPEERRRLVLQAIGSEMNRLTMVAWHSGEDISTDSFQEEIEGRARASAEGIVERWLSLSTRKGATR